MASQLASTPWSQETIAWKQAYRSAGVSPQRYNAVRRGRTKRQANAYLREQGYELKAPSARPVGPIVRSTRQGDWRYADFRSLERAVAYGSGLNPPGDRVMISGHGQLRRPEDYNGAGIGWLAITVSGSWMAPWTLRPAYDGLEEVDRDLFIPHATTYRVVWRAE